MKLIKTLSRQVDKNRISFGRVCVVHMLLIRKIRALRLLVMDVFLPKRTRYHVLFYPVKPQVSDLVCCFGLNRRKYLQYFIPKSHHNTIFLRHAVDPGLFKTTGAFKPRVLRSCTKCLKPLAFQNV
jgi:hypothetical protein